MVLESPRRAYLVEFVDENHDTVAIPTVEEQDLELVIAWPPDTL